MEFNIESYRKAVYPGVAIPDPAEGPHRLWIDREEVLSAFDVEASYGRWYGRVSNPFSGTGDDAAKLCCWGYRHADDPVQTEYFVKPDASGVMRGGFNVKPLPIKDSVTMLAGCNIKFDILWMLTQNGADALWDFFRRGGRVWDVALAEYLLSGQAINNANVDPWYRCSLNAIARNNGIQNLKLDEVAALWEKGVRTEDIPEDILLDYQRQDVNLTYDVAVLQIARAKEFGVAFYNNLFSRMDSLLATTWMEFNGLPVDLELGLKQAKDLEADIAGLKEKVKEYLPELPEGFQFNSGSSQQLSCLLFGGPVKYTGRGPRTDKDGNVILQTVTVPVWETEEVIERPVLDAAGNPVLHTKGKKAGQPQVSLIKRPIPPGVRQARYTRGKNAGELKFCTVPDPDGKPQMKNVDKVFVFPGMQYTPVERFRSTDPETPHLFSMSAEHLDELRSLYPDWKLLKLLGELATKQKDLGTYYISYTSSGVAKGMLTCVGPDGKIHHSLNHNITNTTRLSSEKPNLQNLAGGRKSAIKAVFRSEFGEDGDVGEIDYSQLEVVTKTALSGDPVMKADLQAGVCQHCVNLAFAEDMPYEEVYRLCKIENDPVWDAKRSDIKPFTFSEKYGGGAKSISEKTGIPIEKLKKIIAERKERYHVEAAFDERVLSEVRRNLTTSPFRTPKGAPACVGYYFCVTGTVYAFIEDDAPKWLQDREGIKTAIKPTQTKNYPSQGLGGFIMEDALGSIFRWMIQVPEIWDYVKLRNTVHDCMWTDTHKEFTGVVLPFFKAIIEDVPWRFVRMFGELGWDLKFPAEAEVGPNMLELHHLK